MNRDLENLILRTIERWWSSRYAEKHGLVTSYDPDKHLAKVMFQPQGQESGWLPIEEMHIGDGFGVVAGLTPGDGKTTGDQVVVRYQEGDIESGKISRRVHSVNDTPPRVESGEMIFYARFQKNGGGPNSAQGGQGGTGAFIKFGKDGSLTFTDGNGATHTLDGQGNTRQDSNTHTVVAQSNLGLKGETTIVTSKSATGINSDGKVSVKAGGDVSDGSVTKPEDAPPMPSFEVQ
jgi:hypothetical protein